MNKKLVKLQKGKIMVFAKWTRKSNAAFLSLGRVIKISTIAASYFMLNAFNTLAQTDTIKINEITVNAYKTPMSINNVARVVTIVSAAEISEAPLVSINDALKSAMNVDVRERGAYGVQADINFRGGSFEQNVVLINGVKMNDPQTGHFQMNLPIELSDIERIEIIHGAASSIFGNNAFSGAINLITGMQDQSGLKATLFAGEHELYGGNLALNLTNKKSSNYLSVSKKVSAGYIEDTDFDILNLFYNGKLYTKAGDLQLQAGFLDKSFGANSFYTPVYPNQYEQNKTWMTNLKFFSDGNVKINPSIYWRRNFDRFELFRNDPPAWYTNHNYHQTDVYGADVSSQFNWLLGKAAIGLDCNTEAIISNKLGELMDEPKPIKGEDSVTYTYGKSRQNISAFFENHYNYKKITLSASLMANWNSMYDWNFYPGIDMSYKLNKNWHALFSVNLSGRLPSYTDLYYVGPSNQGNIKLVPEKSINYEIGAKYFTPMIMIQSAVFYKQGRDIIDWVKLNPADKWESSNITNLNTFGFEISTKIVLKNKFGDQFPVKYLALNYTYVDVDKSSSNYTSKYALDYLRHNAGFSINHNILKNLSATWQFNFQARNGTYIPYNQETKVWETAKAYEPLYLLDLKINYQFRNFDFFLQGKNILDQDQQNIENVQLPGRWISGGIVANIRFGK